MLPEEDKQGPAQPVPLQATLSTLECIENYISGKSECLERINELDECNGHLQEVDGSLLQLCGVIKRHFGRRMPELEPLVPQPLSYVWTAEQLGNDLCIARLTDAVNHLIRCPPTAEIDAEVLPERVLDYAHISSQVSLTVTVAASISCGVRLSESEWEELRVEMRHAALCVVLRNKLLKLIENSMQLFAPNLTALVGASIGALMVSHAGSLEELATMPSQNLLVLGGSSSSREANVLTEVAPLDTGSVLIPQMRTRTLGILWNADMVQGTDPAHRLRAMRLLAGKAAIAAREDMYSRVQGNGLGLQLKQRVVEALLKAQAPPPPRLPKPLSIPEEKPKTHRGGRRKRRWKERYGLTETRKKQNRLNVTVNRGEAEEYDYDY